MNQDATAELVKFGENIATATEATTEPLRLCVHNALQRYFKTLDGQETCDLYKLVMSEVEAPLFKSVLNHAGGNQTRAASILGISRSTLRKKLALYDLDK